MDISHEAGSFWPAWPLTLRNFLSTANESRMYFSHRVTGGDHRTFYQNRPPFLNFSRQTGVKHLFGFWRSSHLLFPEGAEPDTFQWMGCDLS